MVIFARMLILLPTLFMLQDSAAVPKEIKYGSETKLHGRLASSWRYGPPGFGETPKTDPKVRFVFLKLDAPVNVVPDQAVSKDDPDIEPQRGVETVRLWCMESLRCEAVEKKLPRCPVWVSGKLHAEIAPLDFLPVTMDVSDVRVEDCNK